MNAMIRCENYHGWFHQEMSWRKLRRMRIYKADEWRPRIWMCWVIFLVSMIISATELRRVVYKILSCKLASKLIWSIVWLAKHLIKLFAMRVWGCIDCTRLLLLIQPSSPFNAIYPASFSRSAVAKRTMQIQFLFQHPLRRSNKNLICMSHPHPSHQHRLSFWSTPLQVMLLVCLHLSEITN